MSKIKIIGNTTTTPVPRSNWSQTDKTKADFIRNKPTLGAVSEKDTIDKVDLAFDVQTSLEQIDTKANIVTLTTAEYNALGNDEVNANTLYMLTDGEPEYYTMTEVDEKIETINTSISDSVNEVKLYSDNNFENAKSYVDNAIDAIPTPDVSGHIGNHNIAVDAHKDIRESIQGLENAVAQKSQVQIITWEADD